MTVQFCDSFDAYDAIGDVPSRYDYANLTYAAFGATDGRWGGGVFKTNASSGVYGIGKITDDSDTIILNFSLLLLSQPTLNYRCIKFYDKIGATVQASVEFSANGTFKVYRGDGTALLGTSASWVFLASAWAHYEMKIYVHDTAGTVDIKVNGVSVLSVSGVDTKNSATYGTIGYVLICGPSGSSGSTHSWFDDIVIMNGAGSYNNDFIGDCRIHAALPDGDGSSSGFTPLSGTTNWEMVDEKYDGDTTYVYATTTGLADLYTFGTMSALADDAVIAAVCVSNISRLDDVGSRELSAILLSGTTTSTGAGLALDVNYNDVFGAFEVDPNTSLVWSGTDVASIEAGVMSTG